MTIQNIVENLRNTIHKKEMLLTTYQNPSIKCYPKGVKEGMELQLSTNIEELKSILQDIEQDTTYSKMRSLLLRWLNDTMTAEDVRLLEQETIGVLKDD